MRPVNRTTHIVYDILSVLAGLVCIPLVFIAVFFALHWDDPFNLFGLASLFSVLCAGLLGAIELLMLLVWLPIYRNTRLWRNGLLTWAVLLGLTYGVNAVVLSGFVVRIMYPFGADEAVQTVGSALVNLSGLRDGWLVYAHAWPLLLGAGFIVYWRKLGRTDA